MKILNVVVREYKLIANNNNQKLSIFKIGLSRLRKFYQIKIYPSLVRKNTISFICLVFKIENKWILKLVWICFLKKQADLKTNCTRLWRFVLMITYNTLTQKYYFY